MAKKHGPWIIEETVRRYRDPFITVEEDRVIRPDGKPGSHSRIVMKPGAAVLPLDPDGLVYLTRQFRYALGRESLEAACGGLEDGESSEACARRELREELGLESQELIDLGYVDLEPSQVQARVGLYLAIGLSSRKPDQDATEVIEIVRMPLGEAIRKVMSAEITQAASSVLLLKAQQYLKEN